MASIERSVESPVSATPQPQKSGPSATATGAAVFGALGVVFGDIGTSPLYTFKTVLGISSKAPSPDTVIGLISLLVWTLFIIATIKYVSLAMRFDNDGEGGILALMGLLGEKKSGRPLIAAAGLLGAALIYSDGAITPAISVLSALEGTRILWPEMSHFIMPGAIVILIGLFAVQPLGTEKIGKAFGPIMLAWFFVMALMGANALRQNWTILYALNPYYGIHFLTTHLAESALVLGSVFLCVTGAESLYADMGHYGAKPIRIAWTFVVWPSLMLNYFGQGAYVLNGGSTKENVFYALCPHSLLLPVIILATLATIIASQSIITGAFSMTRQGIRLGWIPPLYIKQTSAEGYGQIYIPAVNWMLMAATLTLILIFHKSENLTAAYGIAVSLTMLMTSCLLFLAMREISNWSLPVSLGIAGFFFIVDAAFFSSNLLKIKQGGYIPLCMAAVIYAVMYIWHLGSDAVKASLDKGAIPIDQFLAKVEQDHIARVPGLGVFLTSNATGTPAIMDWHVQKNSALQQKIVIIHVKVKSVPWVARRRKAVVESWAENVLHVEAHFGFMEEVDIPKLLNGHDQLRPFIKGEKITYYVGVEYIVAAPKGQGLPNLVRSIFASLERNSMHKREAMNLPPDEIVALGRTIPI